MRWKYYENGVVGHERANGMHRWHFADGSSDKVHYPPTRIADGLERDDGSGIPARAAASSQSYTPSSGPDIGAIFATIIILAAILGSMGLIVWIFG